MIYVSASGERVPALGFGTWQLKERQCRMVVGEALAIGYRHIDTAQMYENETEVGSAIDDSGLDRDDLFVTTKLARGNLRPENVRKSTRESLRRLNTEYVDLLLIHWPNEEVPLEETLGAMMELRESDEVRHIGVSNFPAAHLDEARRLAPISSLQIEYHPFLQQTELRSVCRREGIMLTAYSPLAHGKVLRDPVLQEMGRRHDKSAGQVALRWLVQQEYVAAIPKASSREHMEENFDIFDFSLTPDEMREIFTLDRGERVIDPEWAPDWGAKPETDVRHQSKRGHEDPSRLKAQSQPESEATP